MHVTTDDLIAALRREGLRITKARRAICRTLSEAHADHLSAADVLERSRRGATGTINSSTVYRTLDVLESLGYLRHVHLGHGPGVYHFVDETPHHHLVCEECGRSVDVPFDEVRPMLEDLTARHGFRADSLHFAISGRCRDCTQQD